MTRQQQELREQLGKGRLAGAIPCSCPHSCVCTSKRDAIRHAERALDSRRMQDAAFWTGFAQTRSQ